MPRKVEMFSEYRKLKLLAKPVLSCYQQVMDRSSIGFEEQMKRDVKYI